ncbi:hypothetical protein [Acidovorax sp.]|uniref:hypothetical protein n=1 Tax=Acidovorax sp. TaxID=1872122 RepID=UPI00391F748B
MIGAEFKRFYSDPIVWGPDTFHDDILIRVDGANAIDSDIDLSSVPDTAVVEIEYGEIGEGLPGVPDDIADAANWWRERQSSVQYLVNVPRTQVETFEATLANLGLEFAQMSATVALDGAANG